MCCAVMKYFVFTLLLCFGAFKQRAFADNNINKLFDHLLDQFATKIFDSGFNTISVPDVDYDWSYGIWFFKIYGNVHCTNGGVRSLATIYRTGDADADVYQGTITAESPLGLRVLYFQFEHCTLTIKDILKYTETISGTVGKNSLDIKIKINSEEGHCKAKIEKVDLQDLGDIQLSTGSSILSKLKNEIINGLIWRFRGNIFNAVHDKFKVYENMEYTFTKFCDTVI